MVILMVMPVMPKFILTDSNSSPGTLHKVLETAPGLRWQQTPSAGVNHILTPTFLQHDITLTNGAGVHAIPISEFVLTFILYHAKQYCGYYKQLMINALGKEAG